MKRYMFSCLGHFRDEIQGSWLEGGTQALVLVSVGRHLAAQHSDAGSSIDWTEDLCFDRCAGSSEEDVTTPKKKNPKENT